MTGHWSSEQVVQEFREAQASAMAVDRTGQLAILAGRRSINIIELNALGDKEKENVKKIQRQSKWEVSAVQWNPHTSHAHLFATASNMRADIWSWKDGTSHQLGSLKAHTRVISDVDWSPLEPNTMATCSVDTYSYIWDTRECRKPQVTLQAVAGASQVKWNKLNSHMLATTHDGDIRIWDPRKGTAPVQYIAGHLSKIHGLDWHPTQENMLATSSQDCSVKIWDILAPKSAVNKLVSSAPVWRARYTPFGAGLVTVVVPQLRRGENSLFLWRLDDLKQPVHTFVGHTDVVREFHWRKPQPDSDDLQLVTWSKDQTLRLWRIDPSLQKLCGHEIHVTPSASSTPTTMTPILLAALADDRSGSPMTAHSQPISIGADGKGLEPAKGSSGATNSSEANSGEGAKLTAPSSREEIHSPQQPRTLQQEINLVNFHIAHVTVQEYDPIKRTFTVEATSSSEADIVRLTMHFPQNYPHNATPSFQFGKETNIDKPKQQQLIKVLRDISQTHVKYNRSCIEPCLRHLVSSLDKLTKADGQESSPEPVVSAFSRRQAPPPTILPIYSFGAIQDDSIPYPRTSGARFCAAGFLVCFTRAREVSRRGSSNVDLVTPRAMSAMHAAPTVYPGGVGGGGGGSVRTPGQGSGGAYALYGMSARSPPGPDSALQQALGSGQKYYRDPVNVTGGHRSREKREKRGGLGTVGGGGGEKNTTGNGVVKNNEKTPGPVVVYDIACLMPLNQQLANDYVLDASDPVRMCEQNAAAARSLGNRRDLVQLWNLAAATCDSRLSPDEDPDRGAPWAVHPFGSKMIKSLLNHYSRIADFQTLAMITCAFGKPYSPPDPPSSSTASSQSSAASAPPKSPSQQVTPHHPPYNNYHTIHPTDTSLKGWNFTVPKVKRSNSWSETCDGSFQYNRTGELKEPVQTEKEKHAKNMMLLDPSLTAQYDQYKLAYADLLYRWGLLNKRAELLKYVSTPPITDPSQPITIELYSRCSKCGETSQGPKCRSCNLFVLHCAICRTPVKGSSSFCMSCQHGGHSAHMLEWFSSGQEVCPTGCGCKCIVKNNRNLAENVGDS